ncbi:butyrophilin subfamily 1 member A1-like isoform X2 [Mauremys reevesii]|uniref:butyrophilin subfamily 1 member A1-like isoform X2 n=1 Tax=Mauremys reevesii TaxID=260615 RepID=UPI00193FD2E2|nr:butyrophilin subfamily 1 member A1-like isoform X2 [Mauremys reevesii]
MTGKFPSFSPGSTVSSALPSYVILCLALQVPRLVSAQFTVAGPDHPITASLGGRAVLSCHLSPRMSAENMEVRWFRSKYSPVVHLYRDGQDQYGEQMLEYRERTELLKDNITTGRISLRIRNIQLSDDGQYKCFFKSNVSYEEALLELQVAGLGSAPVISVEGHQDGGIRIVCRSSGWYPQPKAQWRDLQRQLLPSASEKISPEANGLFQTEIAIVITEESNQKVSCFVRNPRLNQERESVISIAEILRSEMERQTEALRSEMERQTEALRSEMKRQTELGLIRARSYAVDVTLDPDTANPWLVLSEDRKHVRRGNTRQDLPNNPERFDHCYCVLGTERFTGGRHYWEVEVGHKMRWDLGVCRESVRRKGKVTYTPKNGYCVVWLRGGEYAASTSPRTSFPVTIRPNRVGIFLDYEAGEVSFYNVTDRSHLFTFTGTFSGTLRPYFHPCHSGKNKEPMIICPVPTEAGGNLCP